MMLDFFKTTLSVGLVRVPFYEAAMALAMAFPVSPYVRGSLVGFIYTSMLLPVTNLRAARSLQTDFRKGDMYAAFLPTVARDMVSGVARSRLTTFAVETLGWRPAAP